MPGNVNRFGLLAILIGLGACTEPPPASMVAGGSGNTAQAGLNLGSNAAGEACTQQKTGEGVADVYCGTWQQPSARVRAAGPAVPSALEALATGSAWRTGLNDRYACGNPTATTILGGQPAMLVQCTRRLGGWAHVALVASIDGHGWYADGVLPALPAMERSIGVLSGHVRAEAASQAQDSGADALLASRLAARSFSSGDIGQYEQLMTLASRANQQGNFAAAEDGFRSGLALQQKALGAESPEIVTTLLNLALQVSNQGRMPEADSLFARVDRLVPPSAEPVLRARALHYHAMHLMNQGKRVEALALLDQADPIYVGMLPVSVVNARAGARGTGRLGGVAALDLLPNRDLLTDATTRSALLNLIEVRRYRGVALRGLGRLDDSDAALRSAIDLSTGNGLRQKLLNARLMRTSAALASAGGRISAAVSEFSVASTGFSDALPNSQPVAETALLLAGQMHRDGRSVAAFDVCQRAVALLRQLKVGIDAKLLAPCLDIFADVAATRSGPARQLVLVQMFEAAQLAQGGVTSQQIAQATARLSENARDPKVAEAIRRRQDEGTRLADLYRERDQIEQSRAPADIGKGAPISPELDKKIADAQAAVGEADTALQAASPNYGQLVQQVSPAANVLAALGPDEGFVSMTLTGNGGWVFLLFDGQVSASPLPGGTPRVAALVKRIRSSIETDDGSLPRFDTAAAQDLYGITLGGLGEPLTRVKSLVVAPAGPLLSLPFSLLLTGPATADDLSTAPWLLRRMTVAHVPAAANFVSLRKVAGGSRASRPWFGFGDFRPVTLAQASKSFPDGCGDNAKLFAGLPLLPSARRELTAARSLLGATESDEMLGAAFTAAAVRKASLKDYRILHFATHALLPAELRCQTEPAIVTSTPTDAPNAAGALLTASAVTGMDLDADTVILSACNSGGPGGGAAGESLSGLARSFFYAGARSLMVTHWSVNDQAAAYLVAVTLQRYRAAPNDGIASAMRAAQLGILDDAGKSLPLAYAHPFYWAPFALIGEGGGRPRT